MQAALLLVFLLILIIALWFTVGRVTDGFADHNEFVNDRLRRYGNINISLLTAENTGALGSSANGIVSTLSSERPNPLSSKPDGLFAIIDKCESIETMDCSAFDDPEFKTNCGVCFFDGTGNPPTNSKKKAIPGGGLVLLEEDKLKTKRESSVSNFIPNYVATVGFCPAGKLVSTKEECIKLQRQLYCQKNGSLDLSGCAQCFSNGSFTIVDPMTTPGVISGSGTVLLVGSGLLTIQEQEFDSVSDIELSSTPYEYQLRVKEGDRVRFIVYPISARQPTYLAGVLTGTTFNGEFTTDLNTIVIADEVTGRKPKSAGKANVADTTAIKMVPGFSKTTMTIAVSIPFTFVEPTMEEATVCKDAPFITQAASANFLESNPCYNKGSGPGKFNLECLQSIWMNNGCTEEGKGFPANASTASILMANRDGSFRTINDISNFIYNNALITSTGMDENGAKQSTASWSASSIFCTGKELSMPCDTNKNTGPLSPECIINLWRNQGANNSLGPTYSGIGTSLIPSGTDTTPQYCQANGTLSPIDTNGKPKADIIAFWQTKGGVNAVKKLMNDLYAAANAQLAADDLISPYFGQCYGQITLAPRPPPPPPIVYKCPDGSSPLTKSAYIPKRGSVIESNFTMTPDYILTMYITPRGGVGDWGSILHMTTGQDQGPHGARALGIWFYPGVVNKLAMHIDHTTQPGWAARATDAGLDVPFVVGKTSMLVLTCNGPNISITVDGKLCGTFIHDGLRFDSKVTIYGSNPWYTPANCRVELACLQKLPPFYPVCEAGSEYGMPPCLPLSLVTSGRDAPACGERVSVFGKPNFSEYNFSIPIGQWNSLDEIKRIPGNRGYTIYGGDGNVSFAFPKTCPLKLTINNGDNFSGPVTFVFTRTCPNSIYSGSCGQITFDRRWDYARSIRCEKA